MMKTLMTWFITLLVSMPAWSAIDTYEFQNDEARARFHQLTQELRCPKCQNQNLADSNSPIASDLRREVYRMVDAGENNDAIVDFMVARYGEFVLYRPRMTTSTWVLWYGPFVLLGIGLCVVWLLAAQARKKRRNAERESAPAQALDTEQQARLNELLKKGTSE